LEQIQKGADIHVSVAIALITTVTFGLQFATFVARRSWLSISCQVRVQYLNL